MAEARERIWPTPPEAHRRFEVLPGAQAQVDWGDEGFIETPDGPMHVWSLHMRYDLNLWIDHPLEGATYLPR